MFAIIDTETSGGKYNEEKIIEIGILVYDGNKIIETFHSLINPQKKVDYFVQKLTGIKEKELKGWGFDVDVLREELAIEFRCGCR